MIVNISADGFWDNFYKRFPAREHGVEVADGTADREQLFYDLNKTWNDA